MNLHIPFSKNNNFYSNLLIYHSFNVINLDLAQSDPIKRLLHSDPKKV
jgi:hypothetical protein